MDNKCDKCGEELVVGSWPWCPHGTGKVYGHFEPFTPYFDPNISKTGEFIRFRGDRKRLMKQNNLEPAGRPYGEGATEY